MNGRFSQTAIEKASSMNGKFHASDFDGVWNALPNVRMVAKVVITGRSYEEALGTFKEINNLHVMKAVPIYFNPVKKGITSVDNISAWKSEMIKRLGVTDFWEDDPDQARNIEAMCPSVEVHLVNTNDNRDNTENTD